MYVNISTHITHTHTGYDRQLRTLGEYKNTTKCKQYLRQTLSKSLVLSCLPYLRIVSSVLVLVLLLLFTVIFWYFCFCFPYLVSRVGLFFVFIYG